MASRYYVKVEDGQVFEGTLVEFKGKFYTYPEEWTDEQIIKHAKEWADNNWTFEYGECH